MNGTDVAYSDRAIGKIMADGLPFGIVVVDRDYRIIRWNGWMEKHSGVLESALSGISILDRWPDIRRREKDAYLIDCVERRRSALLSPLLHEYFLPLVLVKEHRSIRMLQSVKIYPYLADDADGGGDRADGAVIIIQDMTEGILREKEIHRLSRLLNAIRNVNKLMVRVEDEDELISGACRILMDDIGYPLAWIGLAEGPDGRPNPRHPLPVTLSNGRRVIGPDEAADFSRACQGLEKDLRIERVCCLPIRSEGRAIGALHIGCREKGTPGNEEADLLEEYASDIAYAIDTLRERDRRKRAESALRENENRLRQSQKMEAIGVLAGGIAHDFNNILYPIIGFSELISEVMADPAGIQQPAQEYIDEVLKAAYRARDLVQQILAFSRQSSQSEEPVRVAPIIKESLRLMRASLPATIEIRADIADGCPPILADPTNIYQVVMNLCANAFQAMESEGGTLEIRLREADDHIHLSVRDSGMGMDEKTRERIFEPYFTTKPQGKGTGMGLSVVHGIVARMGGRIEVESAPGKGARFDVRFPKMARKNAEGSRRNGAGADGADGGSAAAGGGSAAAGGGSAAAGGAAEPASEAAPGHRGARILVVDDEPQNVRFMTDLLRSQGHDIRGVCDSQEALDLFEAAPADFDLVITDLTMPVMSGDDLARRMRRLRPDLPVILCTGYREKITAKQARRIGIARLLEKPMSNRVLAEAIADILDKRGQ